MAALGVQEIMHTGQLYRITIDAATRIDDPELLAAIADDGSAEMVRTFQWFTTSVGQDYFVSTEIAGWWRTSFGVRMRREVSAGDYMLFIGRLLRARGVNVGGGSIEGASTPVGHAANAVAQTALNIVKGGAKALGDIPEWLALTAGIVLVAVLVWKEKV